MYRRTHAHTASRLTTEIFSSFPIGNNSNLPV